MKFFKIFLQIILMCLCFLAGMQYERTILSQEKNDINKVDTSIQEDIIEDEIIDIIPNSEENTNGESFDDVSVGNGNFSDIKAESPIINNGEIISTDSKNSTENDVMTTEEPIIIINDINDISDSVNNDTLINEQELIPQMFDSNSEK